MLSINLQIYNMHKTLGVPTLKKKIHPIWLGDGYFEQLFMRISKMLILSTQDTPRRRTTSAHAAHVQARLQATWAEV